MREERRRITALFADIVGSTAIAERLDPEDTREILGGAIAHMIQAVEGLGGTVKDLAGDGLLAIFGAPVAFEDDAERAVRAGLEIVEVIKAYGDDAGGRWGIDPIGVRVGIESGLAVLGPVGSGGKIEYGATGDALNTAARLQGHAESGTVLVGAQAQRLAGPSFEWGPPRRLHLKGKAQPVTASVVLRAQVVRGNARKLLRPETPLVGREEELATARNAVARVAGGDGRIILLMGEAGIGKSRLVEEIGRLFRRHVDSPLWLDGRCFSFTERVPYWPIRELLQAWVNRPTERPDAVLSALHAQVRRLLGPESDEDLRLLAWVLGLGQEDVPSELSPELLRRRVQGTITEILRRLSRTQPTAVVLDDLHWADASSVELTAQLLSLTADAPMLLVLAARPEREHPAWSLRERAVSEHADRTDLVDLAPLAGPLNRRMLAALLGGAILPPDVEKRILGAAEGNPFYLEEVVRALADAGALVESDGRWRFEGETSPEVPETVERVILARIDRLPPPARDLLEAAAVIGRRFGSGLLEAVVGHSAAPREAIPELLTLELIQLETGPAGVHYGFRHPLIQEVAYGSLLRRRRRELHRRVASALEGSAGVREEHAGELARHWRDAGELETALRYYQVAAEHAGRIYAVDEALSQYTAALDVAAQLGMPPEDPLIQKLRLNRGVVRAHSGDNAGATADFQSALQMATETADRIAQMHAHSELGFALAGAADYRASIPHLEAARGLAEGLGEPRAQVTILSRLSIVFTNLLRLDRGLEAGERALALARRINDEVAAAEALDALKQVGLQLGDGARMEEIASELSATHRRLGDLWRLQFLQFERAYLMAAEARWAEAFRLLEEAIDLNRKIADRGNEGLLLAALARFHAVRGEYARALDIGREAVEAARRVGHQEWIAWSEGGLGWTLLDLLIVDRAIASLRRARDAAEQAGAMMHLQNATAAVGLAECLLGQRERALSTIGDVEEVIDRVWTPPGTAHFLASSSYVAAARVHLACGAPARAEELLNPLVSAAERYGWAESLAAGLLVLGGCSRARGERKAAGEVLSRCLAVAESGGLRGLEWRAHAALARLARATDAPERAAAHRDRAVALVHRLSADTGDENIGRRFLAEALRRLRGSTEGDGAP